MTPKAKKALQGSINKWIKIVRGTGTDEGHENCPLCLIYKSPKEGVRDLHCKGCPIFQKTGLRWCGGTPYDEYYGGESDEQLAIAVKELRFLQSLMPTRR